MTRDEAKAYFQKLAEDAGLDETAKAGVLAALGNDKFVQGAADPLMRHDDYSRKMDETQRQIAEWTDWYNRSKPQVDQLSVVVQKYKDRFGELTDDGDGTGAGGNNGKGTATTVGMTKQEIEALASMKALEGVDMMAQYLAVNNRHRQRFNEDLDWQSVKKHAIEKGFPTIEAAYGDMISPKLEELRAKELEETAKRKFEEGVLAGRSQAAAPSEEFAPAGHPFFGTAKPAAANPERAGADAFFTAWNEHAAATNK